MRRALAVAVLVPTLVALLLVGGCGDGGGNKAVQDGETKRESVLPFAPDGPLLGVVMASGIDRKGRLVKPGLRFSPTARQVTAIVPLAHVESGQALTVAWYRLAAPGERERLFEHRIETKPFHYAFSVALPQSRLLAGAYEVVATLGEHEVRSPWLVGGEGAGSSAELASVGSEADAAPPAPGESGTGSGEDLQFSEAPPAERQFGPCRLSVSGYALGFFVTASVWGSTCREVVLAAKAKGPWTEVARGDERAEDMFHACQLEGGSDLPGTVIEIAGAQVEGEGEVQTQLELEDLGLAPALEITSEPKPGSTVEPGQTVTFEVPVMQMPPGRGLRWAGLRGPDRVIAREDKGEPKPCDPKRHVAVLRGTYTVPDDPPAVINVRAQAVDYEGREGVATAQYFTGEVWQGTITERGRPVGIGADCSWDWEGPAQVVVAADGSLSGSASGAFTDVVGPCIGIAPGGGRYDLRLSGKKDANRFDITMTHRGSISLALPVNGQTATGSTRVGGYITWTVNLTCKTCEEGVG